MSNLERRLGQQSPLEQSKKSQEKIRPLRDLRAQLETIGTLFDAEITLLPDSTLHVLPGRERGDGHILSRISPLEELEQVDLDLKVSETGRDSENRRIPMTKPELVIGDRFASLTLSDLSESEQDSVKRLGLEVLAARYQVGTVLTSPASVREYLQLKLRDRKAENFGAVFLDLCGALGNVELNRIAAENPGSRLSQLHITSVRVASANRRHRGVPKPRGRRWVVRAHRERPGRGLVASGRCPLSHSSSSC
jgi:hypothetical protein